MFSLNCFSMVAIVIVAVFMSLMVIGRSGGFCDWKWMKNGANPNMCLHEGCIFCGGERNLFTCVLRGTCLTNCFCLFFLLRTFKVERFT